MTDRKIADYKMAWHSSMEELELEVCKLLNKGFEPLGNIAVAYDNDTRERWVYQAMVKYE
jgi:hypothetical protein